MLFYKDSEQIYRTRALERVAWLHLGFGTRAAGDWTGPNSASLKQIHSAACVYVDGARGRVGEGDALLTDSPGVYLTIRTADCVPVLLADERRRAVAAIHAGWRGTVQGIAAEAVRELESRFGSRPEDVWAAIGPAICGRCFEVGPEVAAQFALLFPERSDLNGRTTVDLAEANRRQLTAAGLLPERILQTGLCTSCRADEFHSYRRDRSNRGRMYSAIAIRRGME